MTPDGFASLGTRMGEAALRQRLALEREQDVHAYRHPTDFVRVEHLGFLGRLIHHTLTLTGLRARGRRNAQQVRAQRNEVRLAGLPAAFDGFTLLHLSDLHADGGEVYLRAMIAAVRGLACDACVLTGDYRFSVHGPSAPALDALARLVPELPSPVFGVLGNHDGIAFAPGLQGLGVQVLMNEHAVMQRNGERLVIAGIDDAHYFRTHDIPRALNGVAAQDCTVLLSHTPAPYREAADAGVNLMLSGHTHGGQICLPGGIPVLTDCPAPRRFARGAWQFRAMAGYTSVGCGCSVIDARFQCPPEVVVHVLRSAPQ